MDMRKIENLSKYSKNLNLLYVEDDESTRESMLEVLDILFDNISVAVDGKDGLERFTGIHHSKNMKPIDIIISDIKMPQMNGLDMLAEIRKLETDIPIIILSAYHKPEYFIESMSLSVSGFLLKPVNLDDFVIVLKKVLEKIILTDEAKLNLQLLNEYKDAINESSIVSKTNVQGHITYVNDEFCKVSGYSQSELLGKNHNIIRHPDTPSEVFKDLWNTIKNKKQVWKGLIKNITKSGEEYYVDSTVKPILDSDGEAVEYIAIRNNVTKLVRLNDEVKELRAYDIEQQHIAREKIEVGIRNDMSDDEAKVIYAPLDILSGDFYSLYKCKNGSTFIYIIDGQGHGISPALTVFSISSIINNKIEGVETLQELTQSVFPTIKTFLGEIEQLSYIMIMISPDAKTISYSSGGMYPFVIKSADGVIKVKANNTPFMNFSPDPIVNEMAVGKWDSLVMYSDGFVEHSSEELDRFTPLNVINEPLLIESAAEKINTSELDDDVTLIYLKNFQTTQKA